ncbi:MAG: hypothetical protein KF768_02320 [Phycisphaeraceae bacterium]|nr:hypothetical protein [Phycisphaeraceae bacterium]
MKYQIRGQVTTTIGLLAMLIASAGVTNAGSIEHKFSHEGNLRQLEATATVGGVGADPISEMFEDLLRRLLERMKPMPMPPGPSTGEKMQWVVDSYWTEGCPDPDDADERAELTEILWTTLKVMEERPPEVEPALTDDFTRVVNRMLEELGAKQ